MSHDLAKDAKAYRDKHMDELRVIQSQIKFDVMSRNGKKPIDEGSRLTVQPLVKLVLSFIKNKGYSVEDTKDIIKGIGFTMPDDYINFIKTGVKAMMNKKQTKKQEVKQYPPRYTTSKPQRQKPITSTDRPKLNLSHIQQVHQPQSVSPSESTRKASLSVSSSVHHGRENRTDFSLGVIKGIEKDDRIYNTEVKAYRKSLQALKDKGTIDQLPKKSGIHATNDARSLVGRLVPGRLTSWR